jgi:hypothetical protein
MHHAWQITSCPLVAIAAARAHTTQGPDIDSTMLFNPCSHRLLHSTGAFQARKERNPDEGLTVVEMQIDKKDNETTVMC